MISNAVLKLCEDVKSEGGRALLVGGWVRDYILGIDNYDYDIEVHELEAEKLRDLLHRHGRVDIVGEQFTVYKVLLKENRRKFVIDVSLPRRESKVARGHRGFVVEGDPWMGYEEAARRRDFTVNAMMYDPLADEYIDIYGGRTDLNKKILRVVDPSTFIEDSLRVLRGMQFASRFEFSFDPATIELCRSIDLSDLPPERIIAEVEKWLLFSKCPSIGLFAARDLLVIEKLWPELNIDIDATAQALDKARAIIDDLPRSKRMTVMLAELFRRLNKNSAEQLLDKLKIYTWDNYDMRSQILALVEHKDIPQNWYESRNEITDGMFRRLALRLQPHMLYRVEHAASTNTDATDWFISRVRELGIEETAPPPLLMGRHLLDLGMKPGKRIGQITKAVYELQLDGIVTNVDEAVEVAKTLI